MATTVLDLISGDDAGASANPTFEDSAFSKGLRSGMTGAHSQIQSLVGTGAEALGMTDFARSRYDKSNELQAQAQAEGPPVHSYKDVNDLSSGFDYVTGLLGQSLPQTALALGGGVGGAALKGGALGLRAAMGSTAMLAPFEMGDITQRQQNDPVSAAAPVRDRMSNAVLGGLGSAAAQSLVPAAVTAQIAGKTAKLGRSLGNVAARAGGEVIGEGATEAGGEAIKQGANMLTNPGLSFDTDALAESAVGGAVAGGALAGVGGASELAHSRAMDAGTTISDAVRGGTAKAKESLSAGADSAKTGFKGLFAKSDDRTARAVAAGDTPDGLIDPVPEGVDPAEHVAQNDAKGTAWVKSKLEGWLADSSLSDEQKAKAADYLQRVSDPAARAEAATMVLARKGGEKATEFRDMMAGTKIGSKVKEVATNAWNGVADTAKEYKDAVDFQKEFKAANPEANMMDFIAAYNEKFGDKDVKKSEDFSGARKVINDEITSLVQATRPELAKSAADMDKIANGVRAFFEQSREGLKPENNAKKVAMIHDLLGTDAAPALAKAYINLYGTEGSENVMRSLDALTDSAASHSSMASLVKKHIERNADVTVNDAVEAMRRYVRGEHVPKDAKDSDRALVDFIAKDEIKKAFGKNTDKVIDAFEKEYEDSKSKQELESTSTQGEDGDLESARDDAAKSGVVDHSLEETDLEYEKPRLYRGKGKAPVLSPEAHKRDFGDTPSQHDRLIERAKKENPDRSVGFMSAKDYEVTFGEPLNVSENVDPNDYGVIIAQGQKQEGRVTAEQAEEMKLDSRKYANSTSRISTDKDGVTLDAHKITTTTAYGSKPGPNGERKFPAQVKRMDNESEIRFIARSFFEGLASTLIHHDAKVNSLPDDLVILHRKDKPNITFGQIKKFKFRDPLSDTSKAASQKYVEQTDFDEMNEKQLQAQQVELHRQYDAERQAFLDDFHHDIKQNGIPDEHGKMAKRLGLKPTKKAWLEHEQWIEAKDARYWKARREAMREWESSEPVKNITDQIAEVERELRVRDDTEKSSNLTKHYRSDRSAMGDKGEEFGFHPSDAGKHVPQSVSEIKSDMGLGVVENSELDPQGQIHLAEKEHEGKGTLMVRRKHDEVGASTKRNPDAPAKPAAESEHVPARKTNVIDDAKAVMEGGSAGREVMDRVQSPIQIRLLIAAINDTKGTKLQRANANDAIETLNKRMEEALKKSPDLAYELQLKKSLEEVDPTKHGHSKAAVKSVEKYLDDVLPVVHLKWGKIMHAGQFEPGEGPNAMDTIRLSVHALNPMSTAYHESLHAFFKGLRERGNHDVMKVLYRAAKTAPVMNQLRDKFKDQPEVLKQIETDMEERVAYMYQLYAQNKITLGTDTKNVFGRIKDYIMEVLGLWTNDQRAEHIMEWFHEGGFKTAPDMNAINKMLMEPGTNKYVEKAKQLAEPIMKIEQAILGTGAERMRNTANPALMRIADLIQPEVGKASSDVGFIQAHRNEHIARMNVIAKRLKSFDEATLAAAHDALRDKVKRGLPTEVQWARDAVREYLDEQYDYMSKAKIKVRDLGYKDDYFPRVYDKDYISKHTDEFVKMLADQGIESPDKVLANIMSTEGAADMEMPGHQHLKKRKIPDVPKEFLEKNLYRVLNSYTLQSARRAEWSRRFEPDNSGMKNLLAQARKEGATQEEIDMAQDFIRAVDGTLGDDISPERRRLFGNLIVYQNVRLLPLAIFSQVVDPGGIMVRGGTMKDAFNALKRGIMEIPRGFKNEKSKDEWYKLAEDIGSIDDATLMHTVGTSYTQGMVGENARKVNDALFKYNMVEQFTISMRVSATQAAVRFLARHADGKGKHSERWLAELGLKPNELIVKDGRPLIHTHEFEAAGMSAEEAADASAKVKGAINKWVDGAILRPNSADKPIWMNDPNFALIAHLKQFTYAFQNTILKRAWLEAEHGNYGPAMALAGYVPMMITADLMKGLIQGGGEQPQWKKNWGLSEYVHSGIERAGLYGVGQFGTDFVQDVSRGGAGISRLLGPTVEQLADALAVAGGKAQYEPFVMRSMPANALYAHAFKDTPATDPTFTN